MVATLFGNSLAIIAKDAVRKAAFPKAWTILITNASVMNDVCPGARSRNPKNIEETPVVNMPPLNNTFGPIRFKYWP